MNRSAPLRRSPLPPRSSFITRSRSAALAPSQRARKATRDTGFSPAVKLAVRTRAGDGDPDQARAECCGIFLGRYGGEIQHRVARGCGGTSRPEIGSAANAALMCQAHHRLAEARDLDLYDRGFWRKNAESPFAVPLELHGQHGGFTRWLTAAGGYSKFPPGAVA